MSRVDLHTHSHCSDGLLSPGALVALAAQRNVELLALTDHDTVAGCEPARTACAARAIGLGADAGAIRAGNFADLVAFPVQSDDPLAEILDRPMLPSAVWCEGRKSAHRL